MSVQERWRKPVPGRPRPTRPMPHWMVAASAAGVKVGGDSPPRMPPPPPPLDDPEYEVIEVNTASYMNGPPRPLPFGVRKGTGRHCDLCGGSTPAVRCDLCSGQIFCSSCDDMYHRHPKRQSHVRKVLEPHTLTRPPLPPRGEIGMAPVPPPRSRQKRTGTLFRLPSTGGLLSALGKERQQDSVQMKKEFSLTEKMGSLRRMMGNRPLPPTPPPTSPHLGTPLTVQPPHHTHSSSGLPPSKFHTMREGSIHSSFHHSSDSQGRWRHPSLSQSTMKPPGPNGFRGASMSELWDQGSMGGSMRESSFHRGSPSNPEQMAINWQQSPGSEGRESPWPQSGFGEAGTATLNRRRRSELTPLWNGWQRGGMVSSASVTDLNVGQGPWAGSGPPLQQAQSMAHLHHCPGCMINPASHPWGGMALHQDHWHQGGSMLQLWPQHAPSLIPHLHSVPQPEMRRMAEGGGWPDPSPWDDAGGSRAGMGGSPRGVNGPDGAMRGNEGATEEFGDDKTVLFVPNYAWSCEHCTFVNQPGIRVCTMCCKTTTAEGQRAMKMGVAGTGQQKEWNNSASQPGTKEEDTISKDSAAESQREKRKEVASGIEGLEESSEEESIVTAVQEMEGARWKSYSPRPQKASTKVGSNLRSLAKSPSSMASSGAGDDRRSQLRRIGKSPASVTSTGTSEDRSSQFRRISKSPVSMTSTGVGSDWSSQLQRMTKSPVIMTSTGVGDDQLNHFRRTSRSPVTTVSTAVGEDRPSPFRRVARSPVTTISTGVGDDRPFNSRKVANSTSILTSTAVGNDEKNARRMNGFPVSTTSTATGTEEVVMKVSMAVGTSPPRPMKVEKQILSKSSSMASVGTSPPPQSISTQTYDNPSALTSSFTRKTSADFGSQVSIGQENPTLGHGSLGQYGGNSRRLPRLRRTLSLTFNSKQRESTPSAFLRSQSRHSICGNSGDQSTPELPPTVPLRRRIPSSSTTSSEYYNPSGEADGEWSGGDDDRKEGDRMHGLELVRLLREAEQQQFTAEEVEVALKQCGHKVGEGGKGPLAWLKANWLQMVDTVATLATNFGLERRENTVGTLSSMEAREALRKQGGDVWAAVTHCVETRQRKYAELVSKGNFTREDIVSALSSSQGNVEIAFNELSKSQLKPFLMRIWGPPVSGTGDNESGNSAIRQDSRSSSVEEISHILEEGGVRKALLGEEENLGEALGKEEVGSIGSGVGEEGTSPGAGQTGPATEGPHRSRRVATPRGASGDVVVASEAAQRPQSVTQEENGTLDVGSASKRDDSQGCEASSL